MSDTTPTSALRRKAQVGKQQYQARSMTALRAMRLSLAKVAEDEFDLALAVIGLTQTQAVANEVIDAQGEGALLLLLDTPNGGPGAALLDAGFVDALVQQQTMGQVFEPLESDPPRSVTRTDSALIGPFLDLMFRRAGGMPDVEDDRRLLTGVRYGAYMPVPRLMTLALEAPVYHHFSITVDLATGKRQGRLDLLLPHALAAQDLGHAGLGEQPSSPCSKTVSPVVMKLKAHLNVALCRKTMPLSELTELSVGDRLTLPVEALGVAEILTLDGRKVGQGKLGQVDGKRALRLTSEYQSGASPERRASDRPAGAPKIDYDDEDRRAGGHSRELPGPLKVDPAPVLLEKAPDLALPDLPDLPELPDLPDIAGMGELSAETASAGDDLALPDLPDLPDLPSLPQL